MPSSQYKRSLFGKVLRAWIIFRAGHMEKTKNWLALRDIAQSWIRLNNDPEAWYLLGLALGHMGDPAAEVEAYKKSVEMKPAAAGVWNNLGATYADLERYGEAVHAYEKALNLTPSNPHIYEGLVVCYSHLGRHEDAKRTVQALLDLGERAILSGHYGPEVGLEIYATLRRLDPAFEKLLVQRVSPILDKLAG